MKEINFKKAHDVLRLSHHPFKRSLRYLTWAFKHIDFTGKRVLDIGGGNGIYSYYAKYMGAIYCLNLEPFASGSGNIKILEGDEKIDIKIDLKPLTIQEFSSDEKFDVIILHDSINHLDEDNIALLHKNEEAYRAYSKLIAKIDSLLTNRGKIVIADCSRRNFFAALGVKNPFAPSIDWHLHQHPTILIKLFKENGLELERLRWSPFKRFDNFGILLSKLGFSVSYFLQSHFNLVFSK